MIVATARTAPGLRFAAQLAGLASASLWTAALIDEWPRMMALGVICDETGRIFGHCPACLPAAALAILAVGLAGLDASRRRSAVGG